MAQSGSDGPGRTVVIITLSGGEVTVREALGDRVIAAARATLSPPPPPNPLAAMFAQFTHPPVPIAAQPHAVSETLATGTILPPTPAPAPASPYEAPFVLAPLRRHGG